MTGFAILSAVFAAALTAATAQAGPLTFDAAPAAARGCAPSRRARTLGADAARAARGAAGALPDPKLALGVDSFPISGPLAFEPGVSVTYAGQFEYLQRAVERLKIVVPATLAIIFLLLHTIVRRLDEAALVMETLPLRRPAGCGCFTCSATTSRSQPASAPK